MISQLNGRTSSGTVRDAPTDTAAGALDPLFCGLARLAAGTSGSRLASIAITGCGEAWCTATAALSVDALPRVDPFAAYTSRAAELFEVADAALDDRFRESALVTGPLAIRSYAGLALRTPGGDTLGTLAVYGSGARTLTTEQRATLALLAEQAVARADVHARLTELALLGDTPLSATHPASSAALLESAPAAIYHTDADGNVIYSNPEYRRTFGLEPGHSPDAWARRVHPADRARMEHAWASFCRQPCPTRFDSYRTQADDGSIRHFSEQVVAAEGAPGWIGTITDVTDLVAARDHLRKAETMFRNTFDQAPIGIAHADRRGKLLRCNPSFWSMLGYDPDDLADKTIADVTHGDDVERVSAELKRLWNGELPFVDLEKRYIRKDGSYLWVRMTTALVRGENAKPDYSVEFLRDISARKESAEELERVHKQLMIASRQAGMAEVATNVLHNVGNILNSVNISASLVTERVKQSKAPGVSRLAALLRDRGSAVGAFIDHDERGKRIPEYLTSLGEQLMSDQKMALEELASLRDNLEHIKDTVAMQQSYAKLCGVTETIAVADLVEDSLRLNAGAFVRHGVTLRREFNEVPPITVDKHKVLQILVNLVRNAKYACDESGRIDKLLTLRIEKAPAGVRICVIDNGVGIPPENMSRLFTHGFTTRVDGHGFGLHSGALAAQELGGSLRVESDGPGRGATFILELPYASAERGMSKASPLGNRRILIIDDNAAIHQDFRKVLGAQAEHSAQVALDLLEANLFGGDAAASARPNFEIDSAHQGQEGVAMAHQALADGRPYAMAFVDMRMPPGWDGLKTIERLWATDPDVQVVICSAHTDYDWTEVVNRLGHSDKLLVLRKPAEPIEVLQCATALSRKWENDKLVRGHVLRLEEVITTRTRGLEAANQQLRHLATHDALTGLPNRVLLDDRLQQAIAHADRDARSFALLVCDLDRFKLINDSLGHRAGDELLQEVARRLTGVVRPSDTVARFGGDEFVLIGTSIGDADDAAGLAARVMDVLQAPVRIAAIDIHTSPSIGIAMYPDDGITMQALLAHADAAMYSAKQQGRGNFRRYAPGMDAGTEERVQLESELHNAVTLNQLQLYYQPKVDTKTGAVRSAEALVRWVHPTRGIVSPADFIPLAEECGLIGAIGAWVIREACRQTRAWQIDGVPTLRVSVNLSASQFRDSGLVDTIRTALDDAGLQARFLEVELTESAVMSDPEKSIAVLEHLSAMGVLVSVDDFGTGYSSMSYLRRFPIDKLKIDRVFIDEIASRPEDASIVRAIVSLAHSLRLKVVAEGVETPAQLDFLKTAGCDEYQGYHFSRPLPAADFERLIRESHSEDILTEEDAVRTHSKLSAYVRR